jgi:hypothetical protein
MTKVEAYKRSDFAGMVGAPDRGPLCPHCNRHIPQFADLSQDDEARIRQLIRNNRLLMAVQELQTATGCPVAWAKIWVEHAGRPKIVWDEAKPCPYCGKPLRTSLAKQCRFCLKRWDEDIA